MVANISVVLGGIYGMMLTAAPHVTYFAIQSQHGASYDSAWSGAKYDSAYSLGRSDGRCHRAMPCHHQLMPYHCRVSSSSVFATTHSSNAGAISSRSHSPANQSGGGSGGGHRLITGAVLFLRQNYDWPFDSGAELVGCLLSSPL